MYPIQRTSTLAQGIVSGGGAGSVHSVYRKTVNLCIGNVLLALQACGSPLSPVSLITGLTGTQLSALPLAAGQPVWFCGDTIHIQAERDNIVFSLAGAQTVPLALATLPEAELATLHATIEHVLAASTAHGFRGIFFPAAAEGHLDESLILQVAQQKLQFCMQNLLLFHYTTAAYDLSSLIGMGIGLTPSGDDFLCGVLAGFILRGIDGHPFARAVRGQLEQRLGDTNDISRTFLHCALRGQFSEAVCALTHASTTAQISADFHAIGHSSGMDTLCGILYVLRLALPDCG
ncbi:MAG: DUF2877 domain-containing protein [Eubacteriales bacterium]|nr:DUF2877 domain-containing protein [Eubacteriales bacterium]